MHQCHVSFGYKPVTLLLLCCNLFRFVVSFGYQPLSFGYQPVTFRYQGVSFGFQPAMDAKPIPPSADTFKGTAALRKAMMHQLDIPCPDRRATKKGQPTVTLNIQEMKDVFTRRRLHMMHEAEARSEWDLINPTKEYVGLATDANTEAFGCWLFEDGSTDIPDVVRDGFASAVGVGKLKVNVIYYEEQAHMFQNFPAGCTALLANVFFPYSKFLELRAKGVPIPVLSDYIRVCAMIASKSLYALFLDGDSLFVNAFRVDLFLGVAVGSCKGPNSQKYETKAEFAKYKLIHYLQTPGDGHWLCTPFVAMPGCSLLQLLKSQIEGDVISREDPSTCYNSFMERLQSTVKAKGMEKGIACPDIFSPIPHWTTTAVLHRVSHEAFNVSEIIEKSICVNAYWSSSYKATTTAQERGSSSRIKDKSIWCQLRDHAQTTSVINQGPARLSKYRRLMDKKPDPRQNLGTAALEWPKPIIELTPLPSMRPFEESVIYQRYELVSRIGSGTFATTYKAKERDTINLCAIKVQITPDIVLMPDEFFSEIAVLRLLAGVQHSGIVRMSDAYASPWLVVIVLDLYPENLAESLARSRFSIEELAYSERDICAGMYHLHALSIMHRDLHAQNILVDRINKCAAVCDFNKATIVQPTDNRSMQLFEMTTLCQAPQARAPEQVFAKGTVWKLVRGIHTSKSPTICKYGFPVDIWAIGMLILRMRGYATYRADDPTWFVDLLGPIHLPLVAQLEWSLPAIGILVTRKPSQLGIRSPYKDCNTRMKYI